MLTIAAASTLVPPKNGKAPLCICVSTLVAAMLGMVTSRTTLPGLTSIWINSFEMPAAFARLSFTAASLSGV